MKPKAIVGGMIATYPVPGIAWNYLQYIVGLMELGFEVVYLEDTGIESYHPLPSKYLAECFTKLKATDGLQWHYRNPSGQVYGLSKEDLKIACQEAELFLNVSGGTLLRESYMCCKCKVLIDTDPGLNQFVNFPRWDRSPGYEDTHGFRGHDHFFTYGLCIGKSAACRIPTLGIAWHPTLPPVAHSLWDEKQEGDKWTTVMSWNPYRGDYFKDYEDFDVPAGVSLGAKDKEFTKIMRLPQLVQSKFCIAVGGENAPVSSLKGNGWEVYSAETVADSIQSYCSFISTSRGELSIAKSIYVTSHSGWFSERSVCYLASGKPIIVQDTGFSDVIPTGRGINVFTSLDEAIEQIERVESSYEDHCMSALEFSREIFDAPKVLSEILSIV